MTSPSNGFSDYSRGTYSTLPIDDSDLTNLYTEQDIEDVGNEDGILVGQSTDSSYAIHQFKNFIGQRQSCQLLFAGQTTLTPTDHPVYIQIFNQVTHLWETVDANQSDYVDKNFYFTIVIPSTTNYINAQQVLSSRVYQQRS